MLKNNWQRTSRSAKNAVVLIIFLLVAFGSGSCLPGGYSGPMESLTLGTVLLEPSGLIFVAEDQHLFTENGLNVTIQYYETGLSAANAMLTGETEMAGPVTEFVLVGKAFNEEKIQTVGSIDKVDYASIVARKDNGIEAASDLAGKRIGVARGTMLEFRLGRFLELHGMKISDIVLVDTALGKSAEAIASGELDAVLTVPPYTEAVKAKLGDTVVLWPAQGGQLSYQLIVAKTEWIEQHPQLIERFLNAISQAEEYVIQNPQEARRIVQQRMNLTENDIARIWSQNQFSLSLDQSLIVAMEDEARWMIANNLTAETQVPNFLDDIYVDGLDAVKPEAVNIIR